MVFFVVLLTDFWCCSAGVSLASQNDTAIILLRVVFAVSLFSLTPSGRRHHAARRAALHLWPRAAIRPTHDVMTSAFLFTLAPTQHPLPSGTPLQLRHVTLRCFCFSILISNGKSHRRQARLPVLLSTQILMRAIARIRQRWRHPWGAVRM